jgi:hypothetical protein
MRREVIDVYIQTTDAETAHYLGELSMMEIRMLRDQFDWETVKAGVQAFNRAQDSTIALSGQDNPDSPPHVSVEDEDGESYYYGIVEQQLVLPQDCDKAHLLFIVDYVEA